MSDTILTIVELDKRIRDEHRAKLDASLIVMGALARSGLTRRYIGNTAARVLDHLPCDVLAIPPQT